MNFLNWPTTLLANCLSRWQPGPKCLLIAALAGLFATVGRAASISWSNPTTISGDSDVATSGILLYAYSDGASNETVNGVTFIPFASDSAWGSVSFGNFFTHSKTIAGSGTGTPWSNLSPAYQTVLSGAAWVHGNNTGTVTLNNLTAGHLYSVQFWVNDNRSGVTTTRLDKLSASNAVTLAFNAPKTGGGVGQYVIGTFLADSSNQSFNIVGSNSANGSEVGQINALQVRDNGYVTDSKTAQLLTPSSGYSLAKSQPEEPAIEPAQREPSPPENGQPAPALSSRTEDVRAEYLWLGAACSTVSVVVLLGFWRLQASRRTTALSLPRPAEAWARQRSPYPAELGPQLAELLKSTVIQEMASQRHQLLQVQQQAAAEIVQLMQRLNEVRAPLQERLDAYERQIQELEKELGRQSRENRELLRMQIELLKDQVRAERAAGRMDFN